MDIPVEIMVAHLEELGVLKSSAFEASGENTFRICCPYHDDSKPSATIYADSSKFHCRAATCGKRVDLASFLARLTEKTLGKPCSRENLIALFVQRYKLAPEDDAPLSTEPILAAHAAIAVPNPIISAFRAKGVNEDTIRRYKIGFANGRIWIPILGIAGTAYVNVRQYLPNAPGPEKMRNVKGRSIPRLYPQDQLRFETLVLTGGETKALVAAQELNPHSIGAICVTASEGTWHEGFNDYLKGKTVYVVMDIDEGGRKAAKKLSKLLYKTCKVVYTVVLPLDEKKHPKGDVNDFVATERGDLLKAIQEHGVEFLPSQSAGMDELERGDYEPRTLSGAIAARNLGARACVEASVVGVSEERFSLPKVVRVSCNMDTEHCVHCNVYGKASNPRFTVPSEHPAMIAMCNATDMVVVRRLREDIIGIPSKCKAHTLVIEGRTSAEIVVVSQPVGMQATSEADTRPVQKVLAIGDGIDLNVSYKLNCRSQPDPNTQETVLIASSNERLVDCLDSLSVDKTDDLIWFQAKDDSQEALEERLQDIEADLSCNVTKIYRRPDLHRVVDLVYHSPLYMTLEGSVNKAWIEALVIGDTGQGKSECAKSLSRHYGLGHLVDCANTSTAGLVGGNQQLAGMWVVTWGAWPTNDRKLLILEELKRAPIQIIASLTEMRSSGVARISKIRAGTRPARTRILALSNTRSDRFLRTYGSGVDAVLELIGNPEDVRRFDLCFAISADDLDGDVVHSTNRPTHNHVATATLCHRLISWVWTRTPDQVKIEGTVKDALFEEAHHMSERYSDTVPIVDRGTIRLKLARIAAAIACRTYSTRDGINVDIQVRHVRSAAKFLHRIYDSNAMGYKRYSEKQFALATLTEDKRAKVVAIIKQQPYAKTVAEYLQARSFVNREELGYMASATPEDVRILLGVLARAGAIEFKGSNMIITGALRELLNSLPSGTFEDGGNEF